MDNLYKIVIHFFYMNLPEGWELKETKEENRKVFFKNDYKIELDKDDEDKWYILASDDKPAKDIKGERFDNYSKALEEANDRMKYEVEKGDLLKEYSVTNGTMEEKVIIKTIGEFAAAAKFISLETQREVAIVEDASQFGDEKLDIDMNTVSKTLTKINRGEIKADVIDTI